jgi:hypothetical protein
MKTRQGFVSNSSSSSFIVIDASKGYEHPKWGQTLLVDKAFGEHEFGWGPETLTDVGSRIIFAYFQAQYVEKDEWISMLEKVIREHAGVKTIIWKVHCNGSYGCSQYGYIDHQSNSGEGENTEMFNSIQALRDFIFGQGSSIELRGDG